MCVHVSSTYLADWKICYKHHISKEDPCCVYKDFSSNYSVDWMIYDAYNMNKDAL